MEVTAEIENSRLRVRIDKMIHISLPYREENFQMVFKSSFIGKKKFSKLLFKTGGTELECTYTNKELFEKVISSLEELNVI